CASAEARGRPDCSKSAERPESHRSAAESHRSAAPRAVVVSERWRLAGVPEPVTDSVSVVTGSRIVAGNRLVAEHEAGRGLFPSRPPVRGRRFRASPCPPAVAWGRRLLISGRLRRGLIRPARSRPRTAEALEEQPRVLDIEVIVACHHLAGHTTPEDVFQLSGLGPPDVELPVGLRRVMLLAEAVQVAESGETSAARIVKVEGFDMV